MKYIGSCALPGKMLLVRIIENIIISLGLGPGLGLGPAGAESSSGLEKTHPYNFFSIILELAFHREVHLSQYILSASLSNSKEFIS